MNRNALLFLGILLAPILLSVVVSAGNSVPVFGDNKQFGDNYIEWSNIYLPFYNQNASFSYVNATYFCNGTVCTSAIGGGGSTTPAAFIFAFNATGDNYLYNTSGTIYANLSTFDDRYANAYVNYNFFNTTTPTSGNFTMNLSSSSMFPENTTTIAGVADNQVLYSFVNLNANLTEIKSGTIVFDIHALQSAGTKTASIYFSLYNRSGTTETLLSTSESITLTSGEVHYAVHAYIPLTALHKTDYLVAKVLAGVTGLGTNPTVQLKIMGDTNAGVLLPTTTSSINNLYALNSTLSTMAWNQTNASYLTNGSAAYLRYLDVLGIRLNGSNWITNQTNINASKVVAQSFCNATYCTTNLWNGGGGGGSPQTPWASNIDGSGYTLYNATIVAGSQRTEKAENGNLATDATGWNLTGFDYIAASQAVRMQNVTTPVRANYTFPAVTGGRWELTITLKNTTNLTASTMAISIYRSTGETVLATLNAGALKNKTYTYEFFVPTSVSVTGVSFGHSAGTPNVYLEVANLSFVNYPLNMSVYGNAGYFNNLYQNGNAVIDSGNIGTQSVDYANTAGSAGICSAPWVSGTNALYNDSASFNLLGDYAVGKFSNYDGAVSIQDENGVGVAENTLVWASVNPSSNSYAQVIYGEGMPYGSDYAGGLLIMLDSPNNLGNAIDYVSYADETYTSFFRVVKDGTTDWFGGYGNGYTTINSSGVLTNKITATTTDPEMNVMSVTSWERVLKLDTAVPKAKKGCTTFFDGSNMIAWNSITGDWWYGSACGTLATGKQPSGNVKPLGTLKTNVSLDYKTLTYYRLINGTVKIPVNQTSALDVEVKP